MCLHILKFLLILHNMGTIDDDNVFAPVDALVYLTDSTRCCVGGLHIPLRDISKVHLAGHIALDREDAAGFRAFVKRGRELLDNKASLAIFPEGTRTMNGKLGAFKKGAFTIATKAKVRSLPSRNVPLVPPESAVHTGERYQSCWPIPGRTRN